jgi:hypothetical protein
LNSNRHLEDEAEGLDEGVDEPAPEVVVEGGRVLQDKDVDKAANTTVYQFIRRKIIKS